MSRYDLNIQRGKLVVENGPGSLYTATSGDSYIVSSVNQWFDKEQQQLDVSEFKFFDERLQNYLNVNHFRLPPDFRKKNNRTGDATNTELLIPVYRFPQWHYCPFCYTLKKFNLSDRTSFEHCDKCEKIRKYKQFPIVIVCSEGHISDFPMADFVHKQKVDESKEHNYSIIRGGSANITKWTIKCSCGETKRLSGITGVPKLGDRSAFAKEMSSSKGEKYFCSGYKTWEGKIENSPCNLEPTASLRNTLNIYNGNSINALKIPLENELSRNEKKLFRYFREISTGRSLLADILKEDIKISAETISKRVSKALKDVIDLNEENVQNVLAEINQLGNKKKNSSLAQILKEEFNTLTQDYFDTEEMVIENSYISSDTIIEKINKIKKLEEVIVQTGFKRITYSDILDENRITDKGYEVLFSGKLPEPMWLPAKKLYGEGIFLKLNTEILNRWNERSDLKEYFNKFIGRIPNGESYKKEINPIFILLHSLAHALIDEFSFSSGYSKTSLKDRIYTDEEGNYGILIYTTTSDKGGTYGGLVRIGDPRKFIVSLNNSLKRIEWCSADPVCSELGETTGQGVENKSGAACHNCLYLPETSCYLKNAFLDRSYIGDSEFGINQMYNWLELPNSIEKNGQFEINKIGKSTRELKSWKSYEGFSELPYERFINGNYSLPDYMAGKVTINNNQYDALLIWFDEKRVLINDVKKEIKEDQINGWEIIRK